MYPKTLIQFLDRLYFVTLCTSEKPKSTASTYYFTIEGELQYNYVNFFYDFGPLNLSVLYYYCTRLKRKLNMKDLANKRIVHYSSSDKQYRVNSAYLIASYAVSVFTLIESGMYLCT